MGYLREFVCKPNKGGCSNTYKMGDGYVNIPLGWCTTKDGRHLCPYHNIKENYTKLNDKSSAS